MPGLFVRNDCICCWDQVPLAAPRAGVAPSRHLHAHVPDAAAAECAVHRFLPDAALTPSLTACKQPLTSDRAELGPVVGRPGSTRTSYLFDRK